MGHVFLFFSLLKGGFSPCSLNTGSHLLRIFFQCHQEKKKPFNSVKSQDDSLLGRLRYIGSTTYTKYLFQHMFLIPIRLLLLPPSSFLPFFFRSHSHRFFFFAWSHKWLNFFSWAAFFFKKNPSLHLYDTYHHSTLFNSISANYPVFTTEWVGLLEQNLSCISNYGHFQVIGSFQDGKNMACNISRNSN